MSSPSLPPLFTPKHSPKKALRLFSDNCLKTSKPTLRLKEYSFKTLSPSNSKSNYYVTKMKWKRPNDFHNSIITQVTSKNVQKKNKLKLLEKSSSSESVSSSKKSNDNKEDQDELKDEFLDVIIPRATNDDYVNIRNMDIEDEYNTKIDKKTQIMLKSELVKANSKLNAKYKIKPVTRTSQIIAQSNANNNKRAMRMSVEYNMGNNNEGKFNRKKVNASNMFDKMHYYHFISKLVLSHQNPILQTNREATHFNIIKDTEIMGNMLLGNFKKIYE